MIRSEQVKSDQIRSVLSPRGSECGGSASEGTDGAGADTVRHGADIEVDVDIRHRYSYTILYQREERNSGVGA